MHVQSQSACLWLVVIGDDTFGHEEQSVYHNLLGTEIRAVMIVNKFNSLEYFSKIY